MLEAVDRGDLDAIPNPSWEEKWSTWAPAAVQTYIASAAGFGPLSRSQVRALLQGLPPPPHGWTEAQTVLYEFEAIVGRMADDVDGKLFPANPTPAELAAWSDLRQHQLPSPFVDELKKTTGGLSVPTMAPQAPKPIHVPNWVPLVPKAAPPPPQGPKTKAGRPATGRASCEALVVAAEVILEAAAARGEVVSERQLAKRLVGTTVAGNWNEETIRRQLSGKVRTKMFKVKALRKL